MSDPNKHGLSRYIPEAIKLLIRQQCGFGCACCGQALVEYHHFEPPFSDAHEHSAKGIILLCPNCHTKFGQLRLEQMRAFRKAPRCKTEGYTRDDFFVCSTQPPTLILGKIYATSGQILKHGSNVILGLVSPEQEGGPLRLTCELYDERGALILKIENNEIVVGIDHYDVSICTKNLVIRRNKKDTILAMTTNRYDLIEITHLKTAFVGGSVECSPDNGVKVVSAQGGKVSITGEVYGEIGIWVTDEGMCKLGGGPNTGAPVEMKWN